MAGMAGKAGWRERDFGSRLPALAASTSLGVGKMNPATTAEKAHESYEDPNKDPVNNWLPYLGLVTDQVKIMEPLWSWQERLERVLDLMHMPEIERPWHPKLLQAVGWKEDYYAGKRSYIAVETCGCSAGPGALSRLRPWQPVLRP